MKLVITEEHVKAALDGYLKAMSMINDNDIVVTVKRNRNNDYEIEIERE